MTSNNNEISTIELKKSVEQMKKLRSSTALAMFFLVGGILIIIGSLVFSVTRLKPLENKIFVYEERLDSLNSAYQHKLKISKELEEKINTQKKLIDIVAISNANTKRNIVTIKYFFKDIDSSLVINAIKNLGYNYEALPPQGNTPTNALWYGNNVDEEDIRVIAMTLVNSGVKIQDIKPFANSSGRENIIQLGGRPQAIHKRPITIEQIRSGSW
ncbi:MAG: hypothetical protein MI922_24825, partial [Bacteroidales bacterium]|nr:hypothetical protein [Bacteroidales bacterium]